MAINPIPRKSLSEVVAGKLVASMLNGTLTAGSQLPPERELMVQLAVSRSTVREALKMLADNHLIEARQGVGWFVCSLNAANYHPRPRAGPGRAPRIPPRRAVPPPARSPPARAACRSPPKSRSTSPTCAPTAWAPSTSSPGGSASASKKPVSWSSAPAPWATKSSRTWR